MMIQAKIGAEKKSFLLFLKGATIAQFKLMMICGFIADSEMGLSYQIFGNGISSLDGSKSIISQYHLE
jgi:hypothetical protein